MAALSPFNLTKPEVLMILNLRPASESVLYNVIEDCEQRFKEDKQQEIFDIIGDILGREEDETELDVEATNGMPNGHT